MYRPLKNYGQSYAPMSFSTRFVYVADLALTVNASGYIQNTYSGNSIYDPDSTGAGTTANGHAEFAAIYNRYRVKASRITCTFVPMTVTNGKYIHCTIYADKSAAGATNMLTFTHIPNQVNTIVTANNDVKQLKHYGLTKSMFCTHTIEDPAYAAAMNANPTYRWYWHVAATGTQNDICNVRVCIEYYTDLYDQKATYPSSI